MRKIISREYQMTTAEVKEALFAWLRERDIPSPDNPDDDSVTLKWNGPGEEFISWSETTHDPRT